MWMRAAQLGTTLVLGGAGAGIAALLGLPAPFLMGSAIIVTLAGLAGLKTDLPDALRNAVFVLIGITMGQGMSPDTLSSAAHWPASLAVMALNVLAIMLGGAFLLHCFFGQDRVTALLAASPGHLSYVLSLSVETGADLPRLVLIQTMRLLALMLIVPPILAGGADADMARLADPAVVMASGPLVVLVVSSAALGWAAGVLRVPGAFLLAGAGLSAAGHMTGLSPGSLPGWLALPAYVMVGTLIGSRFSGLTRRLIGSALLATAALAVWATGSSLLAAMAVSLSLPIPFLQALLAMVPGALDGMVALAILMDLDAAYVATHHVSRILLLTILMPLLLSRRSQPHRS